MLERDYAGWDPFDYLASPLIARASARSRWAAVVWTQVGKRLPVQLRRPLRVPRSRNAKGIALVLAAHVRLSRATNEPSYESAGRRLVDWLLDEGRSDHGGLGWGYPFPWANRDFRVPAGTPSSVVTAFVGDALLDAHAAWGIPEALEGARAGATFIRSALQRLPGPGDSFCFSYTPLDRRPVHNANILAAALLARVHAASPDTALADDARRAVRFTLGAQEPDGSWAYGPGRRDRWVDSFHTGYILLGLETIESALTLPMEPWRRRGIRFWRDAFFRGPAVGYYPGESYPVDSHAIAQAILTLLRLRHRIPGAIEEAERLGAWALAELRDGSGAFHYRRGRWLSNRLKYMRWVQAWMLLALSELALAAAGRTP